MTDVDRAAWSGDGDFTIRLLDVLPSIPGVAFVKVEDAPASRTGSGFNFLANEIYVSFDSRSELRTERWLGVVPRRRLVRVPCLTLAGLAEHLSQIEGIGPADYSDEGMLQYLRSERIVAPYQTRGYKLVEMVRVYEAGGRP